MPRPKRTKIASRVAPPTRAAAPAKTVSTAPPPPKAKTAPQVLDSFSDDSDGLVVKATHTRTIRRMPWQPRPEENAEYTMTGALPAQEDGDGEAAQETNSVTKSDKTRSPQVRVSSRTPSTTASKSLQSSGRRSGGRARETPVRTRGSLSAQDAPGQEDESSLLDPSLLTFGSLDDDSPAHGTCPPSTIRVGGTPAHETSILALTNFRRRPRQPSLLRMVHQTTDVEDNDLDDLDDFNPDDESTPLKVQKAGIEAQQHDTSGLSSASAGSRGTKRKLSYPMIQVPRSSPPVEPEQPALLSEDIESERSSSPSLPGGVSQTPEDEAQQEVDPDILSETMAPPRSSSPVDEDADLASVRRSRRGRQSAKTEADDEPGRNTRPKRKPTSEAQAISTAKLQALLPRPRARISRERDEFDLLTSDDVQATTLDTDQDELHLPAPRARNPAISRLKQKSSRGGKKSSTTGGGKKSTRTYTRRTSSDKENGSTSPVEEPLPDPSELTTRTRLAPSAKLAAIAKKFEDVDAYEMAFETVDVGGGSSSPWR